jgi:predicted  nucleic acid-binding Zn-ribbon protein
MSQALVILGSVGLGAIVTLVLSTFGKIKRIRTIKALNKKIKILEDEKASFETKTETLTKENEELQKINSDLKVEVTELETAPIEESQEKVD